MLNVLIVEDDVQISIYLANKINTKNVRCVGILNEGTNVYQKIKEIKPDVVILDLKLPDKNGLEILEEIEVDKKIKAKIFIYSGAVEEMSLAIKYKCVDRFFSKLTPVEEITRELERIVEEISNKNTEEKIIEILFRLGFTYSLKGTKLINDCILYSIIKKEDNVKNIYNEIAKAKGENMNTIKSDINTAINNMWKYTNKERTRRILRLGECDKPSSKNVIAMVKYYVGN
ncbi:MAG: response regulator [Clostridia bacterium]|nr:response regulator [Clostridia bacterium]